MNKVEADLEKAQREAHQVAQDLADRDAKKRREADAAVEAKRKDDIKAYDKRIADITDGS